MPMLRRKAILEKVGLAMLEAGQGVLDKRSYERLGQVPVKPFVIRKHYSSWDRMLRVMKEEMPDLWAQLTEPKPEPKVDPLEKLKLKTE